MTNTFRGALISSFTLCLLMILGFGAPTPAGAQAEAPGTSIQQMMTPEQFQAAGLNKLSSEELQKLDAWLQGYRETTEQTAEKTAEKKVAGRSLLSWKMDAIVSRVDGPFGRLSGRTSIRLEDGTVWKQANSDDRYGPSPIDHPGVAVVHTALGYKMRIQGVPEFYVNPVRKP